MHPPRPRRPVITWRPCADQTGPRVLGINPWVYDFAAYNLWSRPAGLLACLDMFARSGARTALLDTMDRTWLDQPWPVTRDNGTGPYPRTCLPNPGILGGVPRRFSRYGLPRETVAQTLARLQPPPDLILITSNMTYWYPGVISLVQLLRRTYPGIPLCLGGIYATLCPDHAGSLDVDLVVSGPLENADNWEAVWNLLGTGAPPLPEDSGLRLDTSNYQEQGFSVVLGSRGCPFRCGYCAGHKLYSGFRQADPEKVFKHIQEEYMRGIRNFAFYDDALLFRAESMIVPLLEKIISMDLKLRLHTPNALHVRYLNFELCLLLKRAGLHTVRLGFETSQFDCRPDSKLRRVEWEEGVRNLLRAGFDPRGIAAYVLFGLPGQKVRELRQSIKDVLSWGIRPELTYYSPIPGTSLFEQARRSAWLPLDDPLAHNNSIWPCVHGGFSWKERQRWIRMTSKQ